MPLDAKFFQPQDILGITADGLVLQSGPNASTTSNEAVVLGPDGNAIDVTIDGEKVETIKRYGRTHTATLSYLMVGDCLEAVGKLCAIGSVYNGWHIDSARLSMTNDNWPTLEVSVHKHLDGVPDAGCRVYEFTALPPKFNFGVEPYFIFEPPDTMAVTGLTIEMTCNHVDEFGGEGEHIAGDNYDATATVTVDCTGSGEVTPNEDFYFLDSASDSDQSNTTAQKKQFIFKRHMTSGNSHYPES